MDPGVAWISFSRRWPTPRAAGCSICCTRKAGRRCPNSATGSRREHRDYDDPSRVDIVGEGGENDPPHRLVVTWRTPSGEGKASRVTCLVEPHEGVVKLTVAHDGVVPGSEMDRGIRGGRPVVRSSLKTLLETGQALPFTMGRRACSTH
ncbi:SRPBCC domain-containing protein [Burkholderia cepacia]|nr:SRPBCC domain-containing protein [Burkholderia cepacia]EKS9807106.1 SRPBCC domain-containing protein [Burkholderia cepacia]EKS9809497.1 SRPBCC domain-containing protein [Burkholderia cepacia]EKS9819172.1 SRPBCC domain-containing protein [Burkholderia cepacia]EKS9826896.1 SRPBCC domain-containing protein [Burkholderia cepacia]